MKHADAPEKFMDSEVELDCEIKNLAAVASDPELYPVLVELGAVPSLLALLTHENTDIACDVISLLQVRSVGMQSVVTASLHDWLVASSKR